MVNLDDKSPPISFFNSKKPRSITIDVSRTDRVSSITANTDVNEEARPGKVFHKLKKEKNKLKTISNIPDFIKPSIDLHQQSKGKNLSRPEMKGESQ